MAVIEITDFAPQHATGVVEVILPIQQSEFGIPITLENQPDLQDIPAFYQHGRGNFWVALHASQVIGTIALLDIGARQAALRKLFVSAEYRGPAFGIAKRLLDTLVTWCCDHDISDVYLGTTVNFLAAHRFYEKNGFHEVPQTALPQRFPVMAVDKKFYCRTIERD